jgi:DinB superfamily
MQHNLEQTIALLTQTPAALNALLRGLPAEWTLRNEGGDSWTVFDVIGHLIHGERADWMPRARIILQDGESRSFAPFDRLAQQRESQGKTLPQLLDEFAQLRAENLDQLRPQHRPRRTGKARPPPHSRSRHPLESARHVGRARPDPPSPDFKNHGPSIPRRSWTVERISRRPEMRRPQRLKNHHKSTRVSSE